MYRFLPWKFIVQRAARAYGFADPALWLARIRQFAQPSEVQEPIELVRAGVLFHARGIVNAKAIQHNLDWVWPYWVERQFDPDDISFIPRSFSLSHINLTHRNWTAIGLPELAIYPIVDPRGLVTPVHDGWSIDFWLIDADGGHSCRADCGRIGEQQLEFDAELSIATTSRLGELALKHAGQRHRRRGEPVLEIDVRATSPTGGSLVLAIRPYNPEGVQFIDEIRARKAATAGASTIGWKSSPIGRRINCSSPTMKMAMCSPPELLGGYSSSIFGQQTVHSEHMVHNARAAPPHTFRLTWRRTAQRAESHPLQNRHGDGRLDLSIQWPADRAHRPRAAGQRTGGDGEQRRLDPAVDLAGDAFQGGRAANPGRATAVPLRCGVETLVLLSADEVVPGPYTYRRFWFRDACLMLNALLAIGLTERAGGRSNISPSGSCATDTFARRKASGIPTGRCCGSSIVTRS